MNNILSYIELYLRRRRIMIETDYKNMNYFADTVKCYPIGVTGCAGLSGTITIDDPVFSKKLKDAFNPYRIKKIQVNPKKNATTVIFEDGHVEVVKKSPGDADADIYSVVAYAVAKHVYGSNSAFKRQIRDCIFENLEEK